MYNLKYQKKRIKTSLLRMFAVLLSSALALVVVDLSMRIFYLSSGGTYTDIQYHHPSANYWTLCAYGPCPTPGSHQAKKTTKEGLIYDVRYGITDMHTRVVPDPQANSTSTDGVLPVLNFYGGSFMFGEGLEDDETLAYYANNKLRARQVYNYGGQGFGVHNSLYIMSANPATHSGSVHILLTGVHHAVRASCHEPFTDQHPKYVVQRIDTRVRAVLQGKCRGGDSSHIRENNYRLLRSFVAQYKEKSMILYKVSRYLNGATDPEIELYLTLIVEMKLLAEMKQERFIVLFVNMPAETYGLSSYSNERIKSFLFQNDIEVLDVTLGENYAELDDRYYVHQVDKHPSALANRERAELLVQYLTKND